jgi:hypothetical protein
MTTFTVDKNFGSRSANVGKLNHPLKTGVQNNSKNKDIRPNRNQNGSKILTGDELQFMYRNVNISTRI